MLRLAIRLQLISLLSVGSILFSGMITNANVFATSANISIDMNQNIGSVNNNFARFIEDPELINTSASVFTSLQANSVRIPDATSLYDGTLDKIKSVVPNVEYILDSGYADMYCPEDSSFLIAPSDSASDPAIHFTYGQAKQGWIPLAGDWNGSGKSGVGLYNPATHTFYLRNSLTIGNANIVFSYAPSGITSSWIPITGDWNRDGKTDVGFYNPADSSFHLRNSLTSGGDDENFLFGSGNSGELPITGDWNAGGKSGIGVYNPSTGMFYLRNSLSTGYADIAFQYGPQHSTLLPLAGDWTGSGKSGVGLYNPSSATYLLRNSLSFGIADNTFIFGRENTNWYPLVGNWYGKQSIVGQYNYSTNATTFSCQYPGDNGNWDNWTRYITNLATYVKAHNYTVLWDIWNEPDGPVGQYGSSGTRIIVDRGQTRFFDTWYHAYSTLKNVSSNASISGPDISTFNSQFLESFLQYEYGTYHIQPTYLSWHENDASSSQIATIPAEVATMKSWESANKMANIPINLSEYTGAALRYNPGGIVQYMNMFIQAGISYASHSCWNPLDSGASSSSFDCNNGDLDGLISASGQPTPAWWVYDIYTHMGGNYLATSTSGNVSALSSYDASNQTLTALIGANENGSTGDILQVNNIPAKQANIIVYSIPNLTSVTTNPTNGYQIYANPPLQNAEVVHTGTLSVTNGTVSYDIPSFKLWDVYEVSINFSSPVGATVTPTTTPTPPAGTIQVTSSTGVPLTNTTVIFNNGKTAKTNDQGYVMIPQGANSIISINANGKVVKSDIPISGSLWYQVGVDVANGRISTILGYAVANPPLLLELTLVFLFIMMLIVSIVYAVYYRKMNLNPFRKGNVVTSENP